MIEQSPHPPQSQPSQQAPHPAQHWPRHSQPAPQHSPTALQQSPKRLQRLLKALQRSAQGSPVQSPQQWQSQLQSPQSLQQSPPSPTLPFPPPPPPPDIVAPEDEKSPLGPEKPPWVTGIISEEGKASVPEVIPAFGPGGTEMTGVTDGSP
ncbi:hypothetical protein F5H01DRAFT_329816, partial [Linnemannia elongata]